MIIDGSIAEVIFQQLVVLVQRLGTTSLLSSAKTEYNFCMKEITEMV